MKFGRLMPLVLVAGATAVAFYAGCGGGTSSTDDAGTTPGKQPPPPPGADAQTTPPSADTRTFAVYDLFLGEAPRGGAATPDAWKKYGYNIDNKITGVPGDGGTNTCTLVPGAGSGNQVDGDEGIDNSFGKNIIPTIVNLQPDPSKLVSDSIHKGSFTIQMSIKGLTDDPKQTSTGVTGQLFVSGNYSPEGGVPAWNTTTNWSVRPELLNDGTTVASGSKVQFPQGYIVGGTFVNGTSIDIKISLVFQGVPLDLTIHHAIVTFDHSAPADATNGIIAGVIDTTELINGLKAVAGRISTSLCQGSAFDGIAATIKKASDIMHDGTNDPGKECDAISVGIGFTGKQIANPTAVAPLGAPDPDPCTTDAGKDSGSTPTDSGGGG